METSDFSKNNDAQKRLVCLALISMSILSLTLVDLAQFYLNPVKVKIDHLEVFLVSPTANKVPSAFSKDLSVSLFLDFSSGSSFFTAGLTSTSCNLDYLLMKDRTNPQSSYLTNVKVSDVTLTPSLKMFSDVTTRHEITFDIASTQYDDLISAVQSEGSSLVSPEDSSFISTSCKTVLRFGSLSMPYEVNQLLSLDEYKNSIRSDVASLKGHFATLQNASLTLTNEIQTIIQASLTTPSETAANVDKIHRKLSATFPSLPSIPSVSDLDTYRLTRPVRVVFNPYLKTFEAFREKVGYVIVHTPEIVMALNVSTAEKIVRSFLSRHLASEPAALSTLNIVIPAGTLDSRVGAWEAERDAEVNCGSTLCTLSEEVASLSSQVAQRRDMDMTVSVASPSTLVHGLFRSAARSSDQTTGGVSTVEVDVSFIGESQIQSALYSLTESEPVTHHQKRLYKIAMRNGLALSPALAQRRAEGNDDESSSPIDQGIAELFSLAPSVLSFLEKTFNVSERDFTISHTRNLSCVVIAGLSLDGSFCSYEVDTPLLNSTTSILSATVVDMNVYGEVGGVSFGANNSNVLSFSQNFTSYTYLTTSWFPVYGIKNYCVNNQGNHGCSWYSYWVLKSWNSTLEAEMTDEVTFSQELDATAFEWFMSYGSYFTTHKKGEMGAHHSLGHRDADLYAIQVNSKWNGTEEGVHFQYGVDLSLLDEAEVFSNKFSFDYKDPSSHSTTRHIKSSFSVTQSAPEVVNYLTLQGLIGWSAFQNHSSTAAVSASLNINTEEEHYTSSLSFNEVENHEYENKPQNNAVSLTVKVDQDLPVDDSLLNLQYNHRAVMTPTVHNHTYHWYYYNPVYNSTLGYYTWVYQTYTHINTWYDFNSIDLAQSLRVAVPGHVFSQGLTLNSDKNFTLQNSLHKGDFEVYDMDLGVEWLWGEKGRSHFEIGAGVSTENETNQHSLAFAINGDSSTRDGTRVNESVALSVLQLAPEAHTLFQLAETSLVKVEQENIVNSLDLTWTLEDAHVTVHDEVLYGTDGLIRFVLPLTPQGEVGRKEGLFQARLASEQNSLNQFYMNEYFHLMYDNSTQSISAEGTSALMADGKRLYHIDALSAVDLSAQTYTLQAAEYVTSSYGTVSGNYANVTSVEDLPKSVQERHYDLHWSGAPLLMDLTPTAAPTVMATGRPTAKPTTSKPSTIHPTVKPSAHPSFQPSFAPSNMPVVPGAPTPLPTHAPSGAPSLRPTPSPSTRQPTLVPSKAPTKAEVLATFVAFNIGYSMTGITATDLTSNKVAQTALIETVKSCLVSNQTQSGGVNVTIASIDENRRRLDEAQEVNVSVERLLLGGVKVNFRIKFNVVKQNFVNADAGYASMTSSFSSAVSSGTFTSTLHSQAALLNDTSLSSAVGASSVDYSAAEVTVITAPEVESASSATGLSVGAIIGIALGAGAAIIILALIVLFMCCKASSTVSPIHNSDIEKGPQIISMG